MNQQDTMQTKYFFRHWMPNPFSIFLVVLLVHFSACEVVNPEEGIPAFLKIDAVNAQGTGLQEISDVWVFVDNQAIGAFNLPAEIPVLMSGEQSVVIASGVVENGILSFRSEYPFFERYETTATLVPGEVVTISPSTSYRSFSEIEIYEKDWDSKVDLNLNELDGGSIPSINSPSEAIDGKFGLATISEGVSTLEISTGIPYFSINGNGFGGAEFMELHYKSDIDFEIGVIGYDALGNFKGVNFFLGMKAREDWRKIYVRLQEPIAQLLNIEATQFEIAFRTAKPSEDPEAKLYFDNVKFLRQK